MSNSSYTCSHCDNRFEISSGDAVRCPSCMRSSGLMSDTAASHDDDTSVGASPSLRTKVLVVFTMVAAAALLTYVTLKKPVEPVLKSSQVTDSPQPPDLSVLRQVSPAMRQAVEAVGDPVEALRTAERKGFLPPRNLELPDGLGVPRKLDAYLGALRGELSPNIGSFEWALLAAALAQAKGLHPVTLGFDVKNPSQRVLEHRTYAVRIKNGPWEGLTGRIVDANRMQVLGEKALDANMLSWLAMSLAAQGNLDQASRAIGDALLLAPGDAAIAFTEGRIQLASDLRERGWATLEKVSGGSDSDAQAHATVGELALGLQAPVRASRAFQRALDIDPEFPAALLGLAQVEMERLLVTTPSEKEALRKTIEARLDKVKASPKKESDYWAVRADLAQLDKDEKGRRSMLEEGLKENPKSLLAVLNLVDFHMQKQDLEQALAVGVQGHGNGIRDPRLSTQLGVLHFERVGRSAMQGEAGGATDESKSNLALTLKYLEEAKVLAPEQRDIRLLLAQVHFVSGNEEKGQALLDEQMNLFPRDTEGPLLSAQLAMKAAEFGRAQDELNKVFQIDPKNKDAAAINHILAIVSDGDVAGARSKALSLGYPREVLAQTLLETLHVDPRGAKEVLVLMDDELEEKPKRLEAYHLKAVALTLLGKDAEADTHVDKAISLVPEENKEEIRQALNSQVMQARLALKARDLIQEQTNENKSDAEAAGVSIQP